ncbi:MAG: phosphoribosylaminoimidazolesuccinocarboxamide synthase [Nitrososphaerota archaeon]
MKEGMRLVRRGKVKDVYEVSEGRLVFVFSDRVSAFDVVLPTPIPRKGEVLCRFAEFFFNRLGYPHHMIRRIDERSIEVKRLRMVPIELVVRGYIYGSLYERMIKGEVDLGVEPVLAAELPEPLFDPTTKSDVKDVPVTEAEILKMGVLGRDELEHLREVSIEIYRKISDLARRAGFILADLKLEFGRDEDGKLLLADSIGPDEFRLWPVESYRPGRPQESFDKQIVRDWLIRIGYRERLEEARRKGLPPPPPPELPEEIVRTTSMRYIEAFERLTGERL